MPFVIGYQGKAGDEPNAGVTRQWIIDKGNGTYTEYMSQWWFTNPQPNQLGITPIPLDAPIWPTINAQLANFTWKTDPAHGVREHGHRHRRRAVPRRRRHGDVTYNRQRHTAASVASTSASGPVAISPAALAAALTALGASAPANLRRGEGRAASPRRRPRRRTRR